MGGITFTTSNVPVLQQGHLPASKPSFLRAIVFQSGVSLTQAFCPRSALAMLSSLLLFLDASIP